MGSENNMVAVRDLVESIARPFPPNCNWEDQARACQTVAQLILARLAQPDAQQGDDDGPCTDCYDTGTTTQTERPCSCGAGQLADAQQGVSSPASGEGVERSEAQIDAWNDFANEFLTDGNDGYVAADVWKRCEAAFDAAWCVGAEAAVHRALAAMRTPLAAATQPAVPQELERCARMLRVLSAMMQESGDDTKLADDIEAASYRLATKLELFAALTGAGENGEQGA